jgi:hypothetical protein
VGLKTLSGLKMPLPLPLGLELMVGRLGGCWAEGRREKGMRGSMMPPPPPPPASLVLEAPGVLRPPLLASVVMPRKSVLKVRCGLISCGEAGRLSGLRNAPPPGRPSSQERGRSGMSRSWRSSFSASQACFCFSNSAFVFASADSASSARFLSESSWLW